MPNSTRDLSVSRVSFHLLCTFLLKLGVMVVCTPGLVTSSWSRETNFSRDVSAAIDDGIQWFFNRGFFDNPGIASSGSHGSGSAAGLVVLTLLEKRQSADLNAEATGYENALPEDQGRIQNVITYIINRSVSDTFNAYRDCLLYTSPSPRD